jgi:hypothetical protein
MSNSNTFLLFNDGQATPFLQKITTNTVTTVTGADASTGQVNIVAFSVNENAGSTPALTVDLYNGTLTYELMDTSKVVWHAKTVTARQSIEFGSLVIPLGFKLRITSDDVAGKFDIIGTKVGRARSSA